MTDENKTKTELIAELNHLRDQLAHHPDGLKVSVSEKEKKYRLLFNSGNDAIFVWGLDDKNRPAHLIEVNNIACRRLGYSRGELLQLSPKDIDAQINHVSLARLSAELQTKHHTLFETEHRAKNGRILPVEVNAHLFQYNGSPAIMSIARDISLRKESETELEQYRNRLEDFVKERSRELVAANEQLKQEIAERQNAEIELRASQEYARSIIDSSLDMIIAVDLEQNIIEFNQAAQDTFGYTPVEVLGKHINLLYAEPDNARQIYKIALAHGKCVQEILNRRKNGEIFPSFLSASTLRDAGGNIKGLMGVSRDITQRKQAEIDLRQRNRELTLLYRASQALNSTLDLDTVLATVLEEVRHLLDVVACSAWLTDPDTNELVCRAVTDPQSDIVRGWRLPSGQGLAGWVVQHGKSLNISDVTQDSRHFKGVDQKTGLQLRSILTAPLQAKQRVIGVIQVVDETPCRFSQTDTRLVESLAANAATAIENARLYEQTRQDAETKARLLQEVNHRVKNNLAAIVGLLYAERRHASLEYGDSYKTIMQDLIGRVQGLATVHSLLSDSEWSPLPLTELVSRVIYASLRSMPGNKNVFVDVSPSSIKVKPKLANNLALIINELVTNTIKYAFTPGEEGCIVVNISTEDDLINLKFSDSGDGYPEDVLTLERHNVGLYLVNTLVRQDLNGTLALYNNQGAVAEIKFLV